MKLHAPHRLSLMERAYIRRTYMKAIVVATTCNGHR